MPVNNVKLKDWAKLMKLMSVEPEQVQLLQTYLIKADELNRKARNKTKIKVKVVIDDILESDITLGVKFFYPGFYMLSIDCDCKNLWADYNFTYMLDSVKINRCQQLNEEIFEKAFNELIKLSLDHREGRASQFLRHNGYQVIKPEAKTTEGK